MIYYDDLFPGVWEPTQPTTISELRKILDRLEEKCGDAFLTFDGGYNGVTLLITTASPDAS